MGKMAATTVRLPVCFLVRILQVKLEGGKSHEQARTMQIYTKHVKLFHPNALAQKSITWL